MTALALMFVGLMAVVWLAIRENGGRAASDFFVLVLLLTIFVGAVLMDASKVGAL